VVATRERRRRVVRVRDNRRTAADDERNYADTATEIRVLRSRFRRVRAFASDSTTHLLPNERKVLDKIENNFRLLHFRL